MIRNLIACLFALVPSLGLIACAGDGYFLSIKNETGTELWHAPVVTDPPPPHRVVSSTSVPDGLRFQIDTADFNPVFYEKVSKLGVAIQIDWANEPVALLVRVYQYKVPPGEEGSDPAKQPTKLSETYFEVDTTSPDTNTQITAGAIPAQIPIAIKQI